MVATTSSILRFRLEPGMIRWDLVMGLGAVREDVWEDLALVVGSEVLVVGLGHRRIRLEDLEGVISSELGSLS